jgi:cobalt-zinc-cadmium efflux system outer membrane protein
MRRLQRTALVFGLAATLSTATAQENVLTRDEVIALARQRAPQILVARARIDEARGRLVVASALFAENPSLDFSAGRRDLPGGEFLEADVAIRQPLELFGTRSARIDGAEAGIAKAEARSDEATRQVLRDIATAFLGTLKTNEQVRIADDAEAVSAEMVRIAEARHKAGDVAVLDVNAARATAARSRAEIREADAVRESSIGALRALLGLSSSEMAGVRGALHDALRQYGDAELLAQAQDRPDLRARLREIDQTEAEIRLGNALRWPAVGVGTEYKREELANVVMGGLSVSVPVFQHGQGTQVEAAARARRLRLGLAEARKAIENEVRTGLEVYRARLESVAELQEHALPLLEENEALARRSYEAGERPFSDWMLARKEALETKREHLDRLLEAAVAAVELETAAGILQ